MATVREIKATARPRAGKGAARAVRREGRVPGVIYGDNQPPLNISLDKAELTQRIFAGKFLTTLNARLQKLIKKAKDSAKAPTA